MKRTFLAVGLLAIVSPLLTAQSTTLVPDANHSAVNFEVTHLSISKVRGHFGKVTGSILLNSSDVSKSSVNVTIDVTSIDTGVTPRDSDLKSDKYFNVAQFPTATFTSTSVTKGGDGNLTVLGNLTLHGVTKPVTLHADAPVGPVGGSNNSKHMGFSATGTLDRTDFGVGISAPNAMVSNQVKLEIDVDGVVQ